MGSDRPNCYSTIAFLGSMLIIYDLHIMTAFLVASRITPVRPFFAQSVHVYALKSGVPQRVSYDVGDINIKCWNTTVGPRLTIPF